MSSCIRFFFILCLILVCLPSSLEARTEPANYSPTPWDLPTTVPYYGIYQSTNLPFYQSTNLPAHGPQHTTYENGIPQHAYSPFDKTEETACPPGGCDYVTGVMLVKLAPEIETYTTRSGTLRANNSEINQLFDDFEIQSIEPVFPTAAPPAPGRTVEGQPLPDLTRWVKVTIPGGVQSFNRAMDAFRSSSAVQTAEPDYLRRPASDSTNYSPTSWDFPTYKSTNYSPTQGNLPISQSTSFPISQSTSFPISQSTNYSPASWDLPVSQFINFPIYQYTNLPVSQSTTLPTPSTDPLYPGQWHLQATNVISAWEWLEDNGYEPGGSRDVVVAVIDTGVDYTHPDLAANMWVNPLEFSGSPGVDDDGNGYVDDIYGADTVTPDGNPQDDHGHGTHVAGIIAAQAYNNEGGVGVAYNVQIMVLKAAQYSGVLASSDIAEAVYYAVDKGADVINMSFGGYARSQVEEDALAVAFGQAVLVAAAGNDAIPNLHCPLSQDMYPAAYNWVLGVMASTPVGSLASFSNYDCTPNDSHEYELMAPGVDVWSTLPGGSYAAWDGTSMAAPVVSGIAALARTRWTDKEVYSSRFIMGQIASNASPVADAYLALTEAPQPELSYLEHWVFDNPELDAGNDDDGIVDAGETIDLAIVIRNHWGKADPVTATLEARAEGAVYPDPYVTMITGTVDYGAIGSFNIDDNGLIYQDDMVTGVSHPFRFTVPLTTPNDHLIPFRLTMAARNGLDPADTNVYTFVDTFYLLVQRGVEMPRIIDSDMTLTKDYYYLVPDATLIEEGVTVTVTEGTQLQFWSADPGDPYSQDAIPYLQVEGDLRVQGTAEEPVQFFTGALYQGYVVDISPFGSGHVDLSYAQIMNPSIGSTSSNGQILDRIDHCYFAQELSDCVIVRREGGDYCEGPQVRANTISNSIFYKLGNSSSEFPVMDDITANLFDSDKARLATQQGRDNVFLKNYKLYESQWGNRAYWTSTALGPGYPLYEPAFLNILFPVQYNGHTYAALYNYFVDGNTYLNLAEDYAQQFGGHLVAINDDAENTFLGTYQSTYFDESLFHSTYPDMDCGDYECWDLIKYGRQGIYIGLTDRAREDQFEWFSGEPVSYTNWSTGEPDNGINPWDNNDFVVKLDDGHWEDHSNADSYPVVIELPGVVTQGELDALRLSYLADGSYSSFENNAFLNVWWDPDVDHWMHFLVNAQRRHHRIIRNNYWHTTNTNLIDYAIEDYYDDFNDGIYVYQPILTAPPTTTYPFVADVVLSTAADPDATVVGAEPVTFTVTFNRDMDASIQPFISFGPDVPETDYTIHPVEGGWSNPRTWRGTFTITPITGDGYQFLLISGAAAASDPWLVTGEDSERFRFEIITSGTEAMNLQANGGEGFVDLSWTQDDFDLLAGFNLYRAATQDGAYSRINANILPPDLRSYRDTNVQPGQPYYYKFTVVKSDMTESDFSNTADGAPVDTIPPVITHSPISEASPGQPLTLYADVTDNVRVQSVTLYYRLMSARAAYQSKSMVKTTGSRYSATLSGSLMASPGIEYYIEAYDGISFVRAGRPDNPYEVAVKDAPVVTSVTPNHGPSGGGTLVTISGSNFKAGASVTFGGDSAANINVVNSNQITCTTPSHFPAVVDVVVTNTDAQSGVLLRAFTYQSEAVSLGFPDASGPQHTLVQIPVNAANVAGLAAASLTVTFDPAVLDAQGASVGSLTTGWSMAVNTSTPGQVRISMASAGSTAGGDGVLANLSFDVVGNPGMTTTLELSDVLLNEGAIPYELYDGEFTVGLVYDVSGSVTFWNGAAGIPGVQLTLEGDQLFSGQTDASGVYTITGVAPGDYTLTPSKSNKVNGISSYDASLVLQHDAKLIVLTGSQATAADVTKLGGITSMDAFYILQKVVDLIEPPFPGAGVVWDFSPTSREINDLSADLGGQDLTGILLGDVSGNWSPAAGRRSLTGASSTVTLTIEGSQLDANGIATPTIHLQTGSSGVYGIDFTLLYSSTEVTATGVLAGPLADGWMLVANRTPGQIKIGLAGAEPITQTGLLLEIPFQVYNPPAGNSALVWQAVQVNEGAIAASTVDGLVVAQVTEWRYVYLPLVIRNGVQ